VNRILFATVYVTDQDRALRFYERIGFKWIRNWLPYRLSGEALEKLAGG